MIIILELDKAYPGAPPPGTERVPFEGRPPYAGGFTFYMPLAEWKFLGSPERIDFVTSAAKLGVSHVGGEFDVHELRV